MAPVVTRNPEAYQSAAMPSAASTVSRRGMAAAILGNWLEFYDFTVYGLFAVTIGKQFFPVESESGRLLLSLATFGVGFVMRPLGGILLGAYADRQGRKAALTLTIAIMALGTAMIGLTPSYAQIGIAAPLLIVLARLLQGLSAGGEMGAATTYLVELAPRGKRGFFGSWQYATQGLASMTAALLGFGLASALSPESMEAWGWRIPFLFGLLIGPVGVYIRRQMNETADPRPISGTRSVLRTLLTNHGRLVVVGMLTMFGSSVTAYVTGSYFTTYAIHTLHMATDTAMLASVVGGLVILVGCPIGGWRSDRVGRRPVMVIPRVLFILSVFPAFLVITGLQSSAPFLLMVAILSLFQAMSAGVVLVAIPESLPRAVRTSGLSIAYSVGVAIFGGTSQFVATWLLDSTGNPMALAWYLAGANLVSLIALFGLKPPQPTADIH